MSLSAAAKKICTQLSQDSIKMGDIKKLGKEIKKDHALALELWSSMQFHPRMLAMLIMDKKLLTQDVIETLVKDMQIHDAGQRNYLSEWLLANQLMKDKATIALLESWQHHALPLLRRLFWYHQARLRWTGQTPPGNSADLLTALEKDMAKEDPAVQWTMTFLAGWMGVYEPKFRSRCVKLGEKLGLYKDEPCPKNCTPMYLPEFIRIEVGKREE